MINSKMRLVAIVGPTASGKSSLGIELARLHNGEVICADSRTLYRGMDIGTAKPSAEDRRAIPHHMLDLINPDETLSAAQFKRSAEVLADEIAARGHVPLLVGGSGLYVYSVMYDYQFPAGPRSELRVQLESCDLADLVTQLEHEDPERAAEIDLRNKRRVVRALETVGLPRQRQTTLNANMLLVGLCPPIDLLNTRITRRTEVMFQMGLVEEVSKLVAKYGPNLEVLKSPGYVEIIEYLDGRMSQDQAQELINLHTRQLVKRQLTWFKRNPEIQWFETADEAGDAVGKFLSRT